MSYTPDAVTPEFSLLDNHMCYAHLKGLRYPGDKGAIARLPLAEKMVWYAAQDPHTLIEADDDFAVFWFWHYIVPLRIKRLIFKLKFW